MKSTGVIRSLDSLGRVVIPVEIRRNLDIKREDAIEFCVENDNIILKKVTDSCVFCGSRENVLEFKEKHVCADCMAAIANSII